LGGRALTTKMGSGSWEGGGGGGVLLVSFVCNAHAVHGATHPNNKPTATTKTKITK